MADDARRDPTGTRRLRVRLTLIAAAVCALVLVTASALVVVLFRDSLTDSADDLSRSRASALLALAAAGSLPPAISEVSDDGVAQVVDESGRVLAASANVAGRPAISSAQPKEDEPLLLHLEAPDDDETEDYRVWAMRGPSADGPVVAYVGTSEESVDESVRSLVASLAIAVPLILVALVVLVWFLVGRTLRPVEAAHARQRAFVADASHELQSPLAAIRAQLEVGLEHPDGTDWPATARDLLADSDRMERLVRDLLFLARQDSPGSVGSHVLVDLDDVVLEEVARLRARTSTEVETSGVSAAPVRGDRDDLARLVRNLLDNADRHAASTVHVRTSTAGSVAELVVSDDGPGIDPRHRPHVFERFYRGDQARRHGEGSTGLGLAIVAAVAARHGGSVEVADQAPGARLVVRLPSA